MTKTREMKKTKKQKKLMSDDVDIFAYLYKYASLLVVDLEYADLLPSPFFRP